MIAELLQLLQPLFRQYEPDLHQEFIGVNNDVRQRDVHRKFALPPALPEGEVAAHLRHRHVAINGVHGEKGRDVRYRVFTIGSEERLVVEIAVAHWRPLRPSADFPELVQLVRYPRLLLLARFADDRLPQVAPEELHQARLQPFENRILT